MSASPQVMIARDPEGRPWIPGPSIAGSLRAHLAEDLPADVPMVRLMGDVGADAGAERNGSGSTPSVNAVASPIRILGTELKVADGHSGGLSVASSTAIDRRTGAARNRTSRWTEELEPGATIVVYLSWSGLSDVAVEHVISRLTSWHPTLGRGRSVGRGRTQLESLRTGTLDLADPKGRRAWLTTSGPSLVDLATQTDHPIRESREEAWILEVPWAIASDTSVGDGYAEVDGRQMRQARRQGDALVIPGTTWKGIFRSRVEWILRSLDREACLEGDCGTCLPCRMFGWSPSGSDAEQAGGRARVFFHDSVVDDADLALRTRNAIDRFTGGVADGLLFTSEVIRRGTLTLTMTASSDLADDEVACLWSVVRDLDDGLIGIGSATGVGMGRVRLTHEDQRTSAHAARLPRREERDGE